MVVLLCVGLAAVHLAVLVAIRVTETEAELGGVTGDWKAMWAYSAAVAHGKCMEFAGQIAADETACALAPGTALAMDAGFDEAVTLAGAGLPDLSLRVLRRELGRPAWPAGEPTWALVRYGLGQYRQRGLGSEERALAERGTRELAADERSYCHQWLAVCAEESGRHEEAVEHFEAGLKAPHRRLYREAVQAAAGAHLALGEAEPAEVLEEALQGDPPLPSLRRDVPLASPVTNDLVRAGITDSLIGKVHARTHWWSVLNADRGTILTWLAVTGVLVLLTLLPMERFRDSPLRLTLGAVALCLTPLLAGAFVPFTGAGSLLLVAPLGSARTVLTWSTTLLGYVALGTAAGVAIVEGRSLARLGWRWGGPATWVWCVLAYAVGLGFASGGVERIADYSSQASPVAPALGVTCLTMALVAAFTEETLFRGYLLDALSRVQPRFYVANLLQALLFMGVHVALRIRQEAFGPTFLVHAAWWLVMPLLAGWVTRRSGSLWPAFVGHAAFDFIALYATVLPSYDIMRMAAGLL